MKINADLTKRAEVHTPDMEWQTSPEPGVLRQPRGSVHEPFSEQGCVFYVKKGHFV